MNTDALSNIIMNKLKGDFDKLSEQYFAQNINISINFFIHDDLLSEKVSLEGRIL